METKHTKGPWAVQADPKWKSKHPLHDHRFVTTAGMDLERLGAGNDTEEIICRMTDSRHQAANSHLIAAAPDLLEAAIAARDEIRAMHREYCEPCAGDCPAMDVEDRLVAAIAKATGGN